MKMEPKSDLFYQRAFYGLLVFHLGVWLSLGLALDLHPDEADHWVWSRFLAWGYYEHPPMIAWVIRLFTSLLGTNQWAMEIGSQSLTLLSFAFVFLLGRRLFGTPAAFWSVLALEAAPLFTVGSMIFIIDTVLILFYLGAAWFFWKGYQEKDPRFWYLAGLAWGLALLSKVTAVLLPLGCFIFLITQRERRSLLRSPHLYLALLLGLLVFSPFLYWNMGHDWISFRAQLEKGLSGGQDWNQWLGFWFGQPLLLGPVLFIFFIKGLGRGLKEFNQKDGSAFLFLLTLVPLLFFGLAAFKGKYTDPSWTDVGWPFGAVLAGRYFAEKIPELPVRKSLLIGGLIFLTSWFPIGLIAVHAFYPFLPLGPFGDRTLEMRGWGRVGEEVGKNYRVYFPGAEKVYLLADDYQLAGAVSFYTPQHPIPYSFGKSQRNLWVSLPELQQTGALLLCTPETCRQDQERARSLFRRVEPVSEFTICRREQVVKTFKVVYCSNPL